MTRISVPPLRSTLPSCQTIISRRTTVLTESGNRAQESVTKPQDRLRGRLLLVSLPTEIARGSRVIHFL